ncbi:MAG TPA: hypothetical protein VH331_06995 [Allosphingosinicella sp.]|jgi:hypothetical protein|nr:hypothetical protein [Allosphingosinicella sp.]
MYPFRYSSIFKSRWMALLWAAGILWTAYDFADSTSPPNAAGNNQQASSDDAAINQADIASLQSTLNGAF